MSKQEKLLWLVQTEILALIAAGRKEPHFGGLAIARALEAHEYRLPDDIEELMEEAVDIMRYATEDGRARPASLCHGEGGIITVLD